MGASASSLVAQVYAGLDGARMLASAKAGAEQELREALEREGPLALLSSSYAAGHTLVHLAAQEGHLPALQLLVRLIREHARPLAAALVQRVAAAATPEGVRWRELALPCPRVPKQQVLALLQPDAVLRTLLSWQTGRGTTPLMLAARGGHADCVALLLAEGADPLLLDKPTRRSCLHYAALAGHANCVNALLNEFATVPVPGQEGREVLLHSALLRDGVGGTSKFVDLRSSSGFSPLHYAAFWGHSAVVRALLTAGASVLQPTANGAGTSSSATELLVDRGCNALHLAAGNGHVLVAATLLMAHAEVMSRHAARPLGRASAQEAWEGVPHTDPRAVKNSSGFTPHGLAAAARRPQGLLMLLNPGVPLLWVLQSAGLQSKGRFGVPKLAVLAKLVLDEHLTQSLDELEAELAAEQRAEALPGSAAEAAGLLRHDSGASSSAGGDVRALAPRPRDVLRLAPEEAAATAAAAAAAAAAASTAVGAPCSPGGGGCGCGGAVSTRSLCELSLSGSSCGLGSSAGSRAASQSSLTSLCSDACAAEPAPAWLGDLAPVPPSDDAASSCASEALCGICFDVPCAAALAGCGHRLCVGCARCIVAVSAADKPAACPFCRQSVGGFVRAD
ncbi:XBAT31 [Scenedesmus sp. PABB004]|nr:XBAT31 [Scenedesmus sp. PABB004]